ncbi:MAG: hypothetical protein FIO02_06910 [Nitrosopumilales archaeon]|nr:hypothetical protein [Nitrosopumilales archaeon]
MNNDNEYGIPEKATVRQERVRCGNPDCQNLHGPYLYAYWKDGKKLQKKYIGKTIGDLAVRKVAKKVDTTPTKMRKLKVIKEKAQGGNLLAQEYLEKLKNGKVSTDWAYKVLVNSMREQRMLKMIAVAEQSHLNHNNPDELIELFASEMQKQGLDPTNEDNFDSYLNSKIM